MRPSLRAIRALASFGVAGVLMAYAFSGTSVAEDQTVQANGQNQFAPAAVEIDPGNTVTWQYAGSFGHTVTSTSPNWSKNTPLGPPSTNLQTSHLFDRPGTYTYVCTTHESVGMRGTVTVRGPAPKPTTRPPSTRPSPRPTATRTVAPPSSTPPSGSASATPSPSASSALPPVLPSGSLPPAATTPPAPQPSIAPQPSAPPFLGVGGLTPNAPTGRAKGLPVMLALLLIGGVGSAEVRALLANAPE